jgi:hypothetical protein
MDRRAGLIVLFLTSGCAPAGLREPDFDDADGGLQATRRLTVDGLLRFGVFGDVRPPHLNETARYPTGIVSGLFQLAEAQGAQFVVGTGDYMFANRADAADAQVRLLRSAESAFHGPVFHALGNHECGGKVASNCPAGNETPGVRAFMSQLVPEGMPSPFYRVDVRTPLGVVKLLLIAANAWSDDQESWLAAQLADPTAYTIAVRHEPPAETRTPGVAPSEKLLHTHPLTLELLGHVHVYVRLDSRHVISGNGGGPLLFPGGRFGLLMIAQQPNGNLTATEYDQATGMALDHWTVTPAGESVD